MITELHSYELAMQEAAQNGFIVQFIDEIELWQDKNIKNLAPVVTDHWSILQAIFFASTVLTTIGNNNLSIALLIYIYLKIYFFLIF